MTWLLVAVGIALILFSALLSAAETATFAIGPARLRTLDEEGFKGAEALASLRARPEAMRGSLIVVSVALDGAAVGLLTLSGAAWTGTLGATGGMLAALVLAVTVGEVLPRTLAGRRPVRIALGMAPAIHALVDAVGFALSPMGRIGDHLDRRDEEAGTNSLERVVREMTEIGQEEGVLEEEESLLVERAFRLDETTAWDVMTPRVNVFAWKDDLTIEEIVRELESVPYSRVPVYRESVDDITGILHVREALETYVSGRRDLTLSQLARAPLFVPGSLTLNRLLRQFQIRRIHMGVVADEFGGTDGIVTLEDVLEELVGEIVDETDVDEEGLKRVSRHELLANGNVDLREVNHAFNVALPQIEHRSLNGFILEELGHVPESGTIMERAGVVIEVLEASDTQVLLCRLRRSPKSGPEKA
jgi:CBS domain containing-hemolysin-like protein